MNKYNTHPELITRRLKLRQLSFEDDHQIFKIRGDADIAKYLDRPICTDIEEARHFISKIVKGINTNEWFYWAVTLLNNPQLIGTICLWNFSLEKTKADLGYELMTEYQGKGYMSEAIKAVIDFGFNRLRLSEIEAEVDPANLSSVKLLEKFNFTRIVHPGENMDVQGNVLPTVIYSLKLAHN